MMKTVFALAALLLATPCSAATVTPDISDQAGFIRFGAAGIQGNGFVWTTPKYFFDPGTTVDFGFATVVGDGIDGRICGAPGTGTLCSADMAAYVVYFLTDGEGGAREQLGELPHSQCMVPIGTFFCTPSIFHLLFTLGPDNDGIQLAFQGASLSITPVPLPAAWLLFIAGLGVASLFRRRVA